MRKWFLLLGLILAVQTVTFTPLNAQCPMCRMSAESNLQNGGTSGKGLNRGILYMLATPYILVASIGFIWWRNRRKEEDDELEDALRELEGEME